MTRYAITCTADATITEEWEVDADSPEEAKEALFAGNADFIEQSGAEGEDNREVTNVEIVEPSEPTPRSVAATLTSLGRQMNEAINELADRELTPALVEDAANQVEVGLDWIDNAIATLKPEPEEEPPEVTRTAAGSEPYRNLRGRPYKNDPWGGAR